MKTPCTFPPMASSFVPQFQLERGQDMKTRTANLTTQNIPCPKSVKIRSEEEAPLAKRLKLTEENESPPTIRLKCIEGTWTVQENHPFASSTLEIGLFIEPLSPSSPSSEMVISEESSSSSDAEMLRSPSNTPHSMIQEQSSEEISIPMENVFLDKQAFFQTLASRNASLLKKKRLYFLYPSSSDRQRNKFT